MNLIRMQRCFDIVAILHVKKKKKKERKKES